MKKNIVILGSTGSIGKYTLDIISKDKKNFSIKLLSANKNIKKLIYQAKKFKVKNIIINDYQKYILAKHRYKKMNIKIHNSFDVIDKLFVKKKIFYSMISIVGLDGLLPSLKMIKHSKNIGIVNKESLICGWLLIKKNLEKYKTSFIPIDSEHFSINSLLKNTNQNIEKIYITASGGPFLDYPFKDFNKITISNALKHPNWKMGSKISVDSSTLMNKVFEVIEARNLFELEYNQIRILTQPSSYIHAIVKFDNGISKMLMHDADMRIPIYNSIYSYKKKFLKKNKIKLSLLNDLKFKEINIKKFPLVTLLKSMPKNNTLYETVLVSINDFFVDKFLKKKISYVELVSNINKYSKLKIFQKFKKKVANNLDEILKLNTYVYSILGKLGI